MISERDRLFFPSIGFRAETAIKELDNLKEKRDYNELAMNDVYGIVIYCESSLNREFSITMLGDAYRVLMLDDLEELIKNPERETILRERLNDAKNTRLTLEKITKGENISTEEIEESIEFFKKLSKKCRKYMNSYPRILSQ